MVVQALEEVRLHELTAALAMAAAMEEEGGTTEAVPGAPVLVAGPRSRNYVGNHPSDVEYFFPGLNVPQTVAMLCFQMLAVRRLTEEVGGELENGGEGESESVFALSSLERSFAPLCKSLCPL